MAPGLSAAERAAVQHAAEAGAAPDRRETMVLDPHLMASLLGPRDELLRLVERAFPEDRIAVQGNRIAVDGPHAEQLSRLFEELVLVLQSGQGLDAPTVSRTIDMVREDVRPSEVLSSEMVRAARGRSVRPYTAGQKRYTDAIADNTIAFGIGPAGTGKSYLAVALAVQALQTRAVNRIILTRPAVEAGGRPGVLPGDPMAEDDPHLGPLHAALQVLPEPDGGQRLLDPGTLADRPLPFILAG